MRKLVLFTILIVCVASMGFAAELIVNGDAETWTVPNVPDGWDLVGTDAAGNVDATLTTTFAQSASVRPGSTGSSSIELTTTASEWTYRYRIHTPSWDGTYAPTAFSCWMNSPTATSYFRNFAFFSADGGSLFESTWVSINYPTTATGWQHITGNFNCNNPNYKYRIGVHAINGGTGYTYLLDDYSFSTAVDTVYVVDGPGDGDGNGTDDYDTIGDAVAAIDVNDGQLDYIAVVVNRTTETAAIDLSSSDSITIAGDADGDGEPCLSVFTAAAPAILFTFNQHAAGTAINVSDLYVAPAFAGAGVNYVDQTAFYVTDNGQPLVGNTVNFTNVVAGATTWFNEPVDARSYPPPADFTGFNHCSAPLMYANGFRVDGTEAGTSGYIITFTDCAASYGDYRGWYMRNNEGSEIYMYNCVALDNYEGISTYGCTADYWLLDNCTADYNTYQGLRLRGAVPDIEIRNGGSYSHQDSSYGISCEGGFKMDFQGTASDPLYIVGNANRGFRINDGDTNVATLNLEYAQITDSGYYGLEFYEADMASTNTISHCLFARNAGYRSVHFGDTNSQAVNGPSWGVHISDCTFLGSGDYNGIGSSWSGHQDVPYTLTDCVFAGLGAEGIDLYNGTNLTYTVNNCGFATEGPEALANVYDDFGTGNVLTFNNCVYADPIFVGTATDPVDADSFDVSNDEYAAASSTGGGLAGWADFVGGASVPYYMTFDAATATDLQKYIPVPGESAGSGADIESTSPVTWVSDFNPPQIVTPATVGPQGGNALESDPPTSGNEGYHVSGGNAFGPDFTAEALFWCDQLEPAGSEYGLQNIIGTDGPYQTNMIWNIRIWPNGGTGIGGTGQIQLNCNDNGTEKNVDSSFAVPTGVWHHCAAVYDSTAKTMSLYVNNTLIGTTPVLAYPSESWTAFNVAGWGNPAGSSRSLDGMVDAVSIVNEVRGVDNWVLPLPNTGLNDWTMF